MLEHHLQQLIEDLELPPPPPKDALKMIHVPFNQDLTISFKEIDPGVFLFARLGPCPKQKREELFIYLMKANFLGQGTGGGAIGMDPEEKFLTLSLVLPYDVNYRLFKEAVEDFANFTDYWKKELVRHQTEAAQSIL